MTKKLGFWQHSCAIYKLLFRHFLSWTSTVLLTFSRVDSNHQSVPARRHLCFFLTFFDELHEHGVVAADGEPEAILIFLDDYASLDQTCERDETKQRDVTRSLQWQWSCGSKKYKITLSKGRVDELQGGETRTHC